MPLEKRPTGQAVQTPLVDTVPGAHAVHSDCRALGPDPAAHTRQLEAFAPEYLPSGQRSHLASVELATKPASHPTQKDREGPATVPAAHCEESTTGCPVAQTALSGLRGARERATDERRAANDPQTHTRTHHCNQHAGIRLTWLQVLEPGRATKLTLQGTHEVRSAALRDPAGHSLHSDCPGDAALLPSAQRVQVLERAALANVPAAHASHA